MQLNNGKISSVTYPEFFTIYLYLRSTLYKKETKIMEQFFQNFGLSGYAENGILVPKDGPSYDNATKMFNI